jgi:hypothetical protein
MLNPAYCKPEGAVDKERTHAVYLLRRTSRVAIVAAAIVAAHCAALGSVVG